MGLTSPDPSTERTREAAGWVIAAVGGFGVTALLSVAGTPRQYFAGAWYLLVVVVSSLVGGWRSGLLAVGAATAGLVWGVLPPRRTFALDDVGDAAALAAFVGMSVVVVLLVRSRDRARRQADERHRRASQLAALTDALAGATGATRVVGASLDWCREVLRARQSLLTLTTDESGRGPREEWWATAGRVDVRLRAAADRLFASPEAAGMGEPGVLSMRLDAPAGPQGALVVDLGPDGGLDDIDVQSLRIATSHIGEAVARARLYEREHTVAEQLQRSLLPPDLPALAGYRVRTWFHPSAGNTVAGDFFDVVSDGRRWMAVVGDACGKGVVAATVAAAARHTFRAAALDGRGPVATADLMARAVDALGHPGMFCTAVLVEGGDGGELCVVVAGHPSPLVVGADGSVRTLVAEGTILGALPREEQVPTTVALAPGDTLVVHTDGLTDVPGGGVDVAAVLRGATDDEIVRRLAGLRSPSGEDDVALLALTRTGRPLY